MLYGTINFGCSIKYYFRQATLQWHANAQDYKIILYPFSLLPKYNFFCTNGGKEREIERERERVERANCKKLCYYSLRTEIERVHIFYCKDILYCRVGEGLNWPYTLNGHIFLFLHTLNYLRSCT